MENSSYLMLELTNRINDNSVQKCKELIDRLPFTSGIYKNVFHSISLERKKIFQYFLQTLNLDINVLNESNETLLHQSLKCTDEYFLHELLKQGIPLHQEIYKNVLHNAVSLDKPNFVKLLIKYGVTLNNEDILGMTPLDIAIENNNLEIVSMMLYFNCDTSNRSGTVSPFMYSLMFNSDKDIQLLLLEYETDINNSDLLMNNLFIAIERHNYLIPHILAHGGDVNQICNEINIIEYILDNPLPLNLFEIIWEAFDYQSWESTVNESILTFILNNISLKNELWNGYIRIIVESSKIFTVLNHESQCLISCIVSEYLKRGYRELDFYDLVCTLLSNGCPVYSINLHNVYNLLGNTSPILKLLIHMDIRRSCLNSNFNFIRVRYNFDTPIKLLLRDFIINMRIFDMTPSYKDILRYFTVPLEVKTYIQNYKTVSCPSQITWNNVPSLIELCRNEARNFICQQNLVRTGSHYCSIINHCTLPKIIKDILKFERPLYFDI
ncbi:hypothetical protein WA026_007604 [Henosepilachna vigintioctopunctata]